MRIQQQQGGSQQVNRVRNGEHAQGAQQRKAHGHHEGKQKTQSDNFQCRNGMDGFNPQSYDGQGTLADRAQESSGSENGGGCDGGDRSERSEGGRGKDRAHRSGGRQHVQQAEQPAAVDDSGDSAGIAQQPQEQNPLLQLLTLLLSAVLQAGNQQNGNGLAQLLQQGGNQAQQTTAV